MAADSLILVSLGEEFLALDRSTFERARNLGRELMPPSSPASAVPAAASEIIVDAEGMNRRTGVPASWFEQAAREGRIPCLHFGKYVRFDLKQVLETLASGARKDMPAPGPVRLRRRSA